MQELKLKTSEKKIMNIEIYQIPDNSLAALDYHDSYTRTNNFNFPIEKFSSALMNAVIFVVSENHEFENRYLKSLQ